MRLVFGSALVFLAFAVFAEGQGCVISPQHLELPTGYPNVARAARLQGTVTVQLTISGDGKVTTADATSKVSNSRAFNTSPNVFFCPRPVCDCPQGPTRVLRPTGTC